MILHVSSKTQRVELRNQGLCDWTAPVSTALLGLGEKPGSFKTPHGWHHIAEKIGDGTPLLGIFESRVYTGQIWDGKPIEEDLILTRILWLAGDEDFNQSTHSRYIYFHGTNHEEALGAPGSHGCIRMKNADIKTLFDKVSVKTRVFIE